MGRPTTATEDFDRRPMDGPPAPATIAGSERRPLEETPAATSDSERWSTEGLSAATADSERRPTSRLSAATDVSEKRQITLEPGAIADSERGVSLILRAI